MQTVFDFTLKLVPFVDHTEARNAPALGTVSLPRPTTARHRVPPLVQSTIALHHMVPSSSTEPFSGTGGHHGCGAGPSALPRGNPAEGPERRSPPPAPPLFTRPS